MHTRAFFFFFLLAVGTSSPAWTQAQESASGSDIPTGSGTVAAPADQSSIDPKIEKDRKRRAADFKVFLVKLKTAEKPYRAALADYHRKRAANRVQCQGDIRRSNKDQKLPTILRCYRAELTLDRDILLAQRDYIDQVPGQFPIFKKQLREPVETLLEAINSFVNAIDHDVFEEEEQLREAKRNLFENYRVPAVQAMAMMRADIDLHWTASLLEKTRKAKEEQETRAGQPSEAWAAAERCLLYSDGLLRGVLEPETADTQLAWRDAAQNVRACVGQIAAIRDQDAATGSGATP